MSYHYDKVKPDILNENGIALIIRLHNRASVLAKLSGVFTVGKLIEGLTGDSWHLLAAVDLLIDAQALSIVSCPGSTLGRVIRLNY